MTSSSLPSSSSSYYYYYYYYYQERVIEVDEDDKPLRAASKLETHLVKYGPILHRAFSVFLFDTKGR